MRHSWDWDCEDLRWHAFRAMFGYFIKLGIYPELMGKEEYACLNRLCKFK